MQFELFGIIKDRQRVVGYILKYGVHDYFVTKEYGIKIGYNKLIKDVTVENNTVVGERLVNKVTGNKIIPNIDISELIMHGIVLESTIEGLEIRDRKFNKPEIVGCIFNNYGVIKGIRVRNGEEVITIGYPGVKKIWEGPRNRGEPVKILKKPEHYSKYSHRYNFYESTISGGVMYFGLKLISSHLTIKLANELYGVENNVIDNSVPADPLDLEIRKKVIVTARKMEYNIIKNSRVYEYIKGECKVIARVKTRKPFSEEDKKIGRLVVKTDDNTYIVVSSALFNDPRVRNLPEIILYDGDVMYGNAYEDRGKIIISGMRGGERLKNRIRKAISTGGISYEQFMRDNLEGIVG